MKVTFLGTGTSQGVPVVACRCSVCKSTDGHDNRLRASILVEVNGLNLVIDAGPDFRQQMLTVNLEKLDAILLTHEHYDHIAGLDDIRAFNWIQQKPTDIYAEHRVQQSVRQIFSYVFASNKYPGIPQMNLYDVDESEFFIRNTKIIPIRGMHYKLPVLGFRIGQFAYLTDMKTIDKLELAKLEGVRVMVINALRKEEHISHMNLEQALGYIGSIKPEKAYITHISHQMGLSDLIGRELPKNVYLAYDGLAIDLDE